MRGLTTVLISSAALALAACPRSRSGESDASAKTEAGTPDGASLDARSPAAPDAATAPAALEEGPHDYRGTIATTTSVAMHLVRSGSKVTGAYAYAQVGRPIGLDGTIDADGAISLSEFVGRDVTGHFGLRPEGRSLVGSWSDLSRKKTLPITLTPSAPVATLAGDAGAPPTANHQAEQCLADVACPAEEAERLFLAADDAHATDFDCTRFLDGVGVKKDETRGRACFERTAGHTACEGSSPDLSIALLSEMRIDGVGGPRDLAAVRKVLATCFEDVTVSALLERADTVTKNPSTPRFDFCKEIGGTQLVFDDCKARERERERDRASLLAKRAADHLDDKGRELFRSAAKAYEAYVLADSVHVLAVYAGGSMRYAVELAREAALEEERAKDLAAFETFVAPAVTANDVARARSANAKALAAAAPDASLPPEDRAREKKALDDAQASWTKYRDAELTLYVHVFGAAQGEAKVRDAVTVMLTSRRSKACAAPSLHDEQ